MLQLQSPERRKRRRRIHIDEDIYSKRRRCEAFWVKTFRRLKLNRNR